jgi:prepilin-type N-terminal cleavage/methylation domain-containing protein
MRRVRQAILPAFRRAHGRPGPAPTAFSLLELMVVIAIIGLINGLTIAFSGNEWQRERLNQASLGLAGWLEEVRGNALRETSDNPAAGGCVITVNNLSNATAGTALASVSPSTCASPATFVLPGVVNSADRYDTATSNAERIEFTPRGSVTSSSDAVVRIFLRGSRQLRCVRVSAILGLVRVGNNSAAASSADACTDYSRF